MHAMLLIVILNHKYSGQACVRRAQNDGSSRVCRWSKLPVLGLRAYSSAPCVRRRHPDADGVGA